MVFCGVLLVTGLSPRPKENRQAVASTNWVPTQFVNYTNLGPSTSVVQITSRPMSPEEFSRYSSSLYYPHDSTVYGRPNYSPVMFLWTDESTKDHVQWCGFHNMTWEISTNWINGYDGFDYGLIQSNVVANMIWRDQVVGRFILETNFIGVLQRERPKETAL